MSFSSWAKGIFNGTTTANASAPSNVGGLGNFWSGLDNMFTGNLDYLRQWELFSKEMEFNSAQAEETPRESAVLKSPARISKPEPLFPA